MAAIFVNLSETGEHLFKNHFNVNTSVRIPFLEGLIGEKGFMVVSNVQVSNNEILQFFPTFDDLITYYYFGGGLGSLTVTGSLFTDCYGSMRGLDPLLNSIGQIRGKQVPVQFGSAVFESVLTSFSVSASDDSHGPMVDFNIQFTVVRNNLPLAYNPPNC